jgi:hypothetical protein
MVILPLTLILLGVSTIILTLLSQRRELKGGCCGDKCICKNN